MSIYEFNERVKETVDNYYKNRDAESFFTIDAMLNACKKQGLTVEQVPQLIEMQNIIVMG